MLSSFCSEFQNNFIESPLLQRSPGLLSHVWFSISCLTINLRGFQNLAEHSFDNLNKSRCSIHALKNPFVLVFPWTVWSANYHLTCLPYSQIHELTWAALSLLALPWDCWVLFFCWDTSSGAIPASLGHSILSLTVILALRSGNGLFVAQRGNKRIRPLLLSACSYFLICMDNIMLINIFFNYDLHCPFRICNSFWFI